jgi:excisionase family DNA binding protein
MAVLEEEAILPKESEKPDIVKIGGVLEVGECAKLVSADGKEEIILPQTVFQVLRQIVYHMMQGRAIFIMPANKEVTTQAAADFLNVSRPFLIKLLEDGKIPFIKIGTHRRIRFSDLVDYKKKRDARREQALEKIAQVSQELGIYDSTVLCLLDLAGREII